MSVLAAIASWSVVAFAALLWVAQMLAHEAGYWVGARHRTRGGEVQAEGVGLVVGGILGLLAFVLALTLSFANTRFSERVEYPCRGQRDRHRVAAGGGDRPSPRPRDRKTARGVYSGQTGLRQPRTKSVQYRRAQSPHQCLAVSNMGARGGNRARTAEPGFGIADGGAQRRFRPSNGRTLCLLFAFAGADFLVVARDDLVGDGRPWLSTGSERNTNTHIGCVPQHHVDGRDRRHPRSGLAPHRRLARRNRRLRLDLARLHGRAPNPSGPDFQIAPLPNRTATLTRRAALRAARPVVLEHGFAAGHSREASDGL